MSQAIGPSVEHPMLAALAVVEDGAGRLAEACSWSMSDEDIGVALGRLAAVEARLAAVKLALVGQADGRGLGATQATTTAGWLRARLLLHPGEAGRVVRLAGALPAESPAAAAALAAGVISAEHARVITTVLAGLPPVDADTRTRAEEFLITQASALDPVQLGQAGRALTEKLTTAPDSDPDERIVRQVTRRELTLTTAYDGMTLLRGQLDPEAAALLSAALDPLAAPHPAGPDRTPDPRSPARRRADALTDLARLALAAGDLPAAGGLRPTLTVTINHDVLTGRLAGAGLLNTGEPISAAATRRLACDAGIIPLVLGGPSQPLDIGRATRTVPPGMRRALIARDQACSFPTCDRPAPWCESHHIIWWTTQQGPTALHNLALLCGAHHDAVHHHGWTVTIDPDGLPTYQPPPWIDPTTQPQRNHRYALRQHTQPTHNPTGHDPPA
jgi:hypothetical protein